MPAWAVLIEVVALLLLLFGTILAAFRASRKPLLTPWSLLAAGGGAVLASFLTVLLSPQRPAGPLVLTLIIVGLAGGIAVGYTARLQTRDGRMQSSQGSLYLVAWSGLLLIATPLLTFGRQAAIMGTSLVILSSTVVAGYTYYIYMRYARTRQRSATVRPNGLPQQ